MYLSEDEASGLRRMAAATGRSQSELIREGVQHVVSQPPKRTFHSMGVADGPPYAPWDPAEVYARAMGLTLDTTGGAARWIDEAVDHATHVAEGA